MYGVSVYINSNVKELKFNYLVVLLLEKDDALIFWVSNKKIVIRSVVKYGRS